MAQKHNCVLICGKDPRNTPLPCRSLTCGDFCSTKLILNQASSLMETLCWSYWSALKRSLATKHDVIYFFSIQGAFHSAVISVCERKWGNYWRSRPLLCKSLTAALTNSSERLFISPTWGIQDPGGEEARHQGGGGGYGNTGKVMLNSETLTAKN